MNYSIEYFHSRVQAEIESWPDGILADFARILELMMEFGPNLRMLHTRGQWAVVSSRCAHVDERVWDEHFIVMNEV